MTDTATLPRVLRGTCVDCGTEVELRHADGIGGEGLSWPCLVCGDPIRLEGSDYTD